jgi:ribosomal protein S18 acetylase RimI-like enzyme
VQAIENNLCEAFNVLPEYFHVEQDATWFWMPQAPNRFVNGIWNTRLPEGASCDDRVEELLEPFKSSKTPVNWYVTPSCTPPNLGSILEKHGLHYEGEDPGMALPLSELPNMETPKGLTIKLVENKALLEQWVRAFSLVFNVPKHRQGELMIHQEPLGYSPEGKTRRFIGILNSEVIATSIVVFAPGAAVLFGVSVLGEHRGKGIGAAMTLHPLHLARSRGYNLAVLGSTEMGLPLYKKLGFKEYIKIRNYVGNFSSQ